MKAVHKKKNIYEKLKGNTTVILNRDIWFTKDVSGDPDIPKGTELKVVQIILKDSEIKVDHKGRIFTLPKQWTDG